MNEEAVLIDLIKKRRSVRAYTHEPVNKKDISDILSAAAYTPSAFHAQPWRVYALTGRAKEEVTSKVLATFDGIVSGQINSEDYQERQAISPKEWVEPYKSRRIEVGKALYSQLAIERHDKVGRIIQERKNYEFFGAPVGLFLTADKRLAIGAKRDIGSFIQSIVLLAVAKGLATCIQAAWVRFETLILPLIGASEVEELVCGIALGYELHGDKASNLPLHRLQVDDFTTWAGFED
jgi:nitroreductase